MSNLKELRDELFDTLKQVKNGKIAPATANAISNLSQNIIETAKVQLHAAKLLNDKELDNEVKNSILTPTDKRISDGK